MGGNYVYPNEGFENKCIAWIIIGLLEIINELKIVAGWGHLSMRKIYIFPQLENNLIKLFLFYIK